MVKAGDIVKVRVLEVDVPRKRIALTRRLDDSVVREPRNESRERSAAAPRGREDRRPPAMPQRPANNALAAAFARAKKD